MKIHKYKNYKSYVKEQVKKNKKKLHTLWAAPQVLEFVTAYVKEHIPAPKFGICHGAKHGWEVEYLRKSLGIEVIGTDIAPTAKKFPFMIQWDFHEIKEGWEGNVDFIYSNSLDHSHDPPLCIDRWMQCLKPGGRCFVEWSLMHGETHVSESDPFGASADEYRQLLQAKYKVEEERDFQKQEGWRYQVDRKIFVVARP
jgi:hypothetical protein